MALKAAQSQETAVSPGSWYVSNTKLSPSLYYLCLRMSKGECCNFLYYSFEQSWSIANTGNDPWPGSCRLIQAGGEFFSMSAESVPSLQPGQTTTILLKLVAPWTPGTHRGYFHLVNDKGEQIGGWLLWNVFWVLIPKHLPNNINYLLTLNFNYQIIGVCSRSRCLLSLFCIDRVTMIWKFRTIRRFKLLFLVLLNA